MGERKLLDPRKQFSKWLARVGAIYWIVFLTLVVGLIYFRPDAAQSCVYLVLIVTVNKIVDTLAYTDNSKTEKFLLTALDRTRMELTIGKGRSRSEDAPDDSMEGESNG